MKNTPAVAVAPRFVIAPGVGVFGGRRVGVGSTYSGGSASRGGFRALLLMATRFLIAGAFWMAWQLRWRGGADRTGMAKRIAGGHLDAGRRHGRYGIMRNKHRVGLVVAVMPVIPILLVVINLAFRVYPRRSELVAVCVGLRA